MNTVPVERSAVELALELLGDGFEFCEEYFDKPNRCAHGCEAAYGESSGYPEPDPAYLTHRPGCPWITVVTALQRALG